MALRKRTNHQSSRGIVPVSVLCRPNFSLRCRARLRCRRHVMPMTMLRRPHLSWRHGTGRLRGQATGRIRGMRLRWDGGFGWRIGWPVCHDRCHDHHATDGKTTEPERVTFLGWLSFFHPDTTVFELLPTAARARLISTDFCRHNSIPSAQSAHQVKPQIWDVVPSESTSKGKPTHFASLAFLTKGSENLAQNCLGAIAH